MKLKIIQVSSSNHRPADHKNFLGDIQSTPEIIEDTAESWQWVQTYVTQGDRVIIERVGI